MTKKLVLIDGNSIAYRAFFALPLLNNDKGIHTNAIYGFTTMLFRILENEKPTHLLVAFDAGKTTFRHETYKEYKGGRQKTPSELSEQFPLLRELLDAFSIKHYQLNQYEADDIIGTLTKQAETDDFEIKVISGDKDLLQLVSDKTTIQLTRKGISEIDSYTPDFLLENMEVTPDQIIDMKALMGDSSDNIPGVPGVGQKTAVKLLKQFQTLDRIYEQLDDVSGKSIKQKLTDNKESAFMSRELATIETKAPIEVSLEEINYDGFQPAAVSTIFKDLGFQSLLGRLGEEGAPEEVSQELTPLDVTIVDNITEDLFTGEDALVVEMLTDNYHTAQIEGFGLANANGAFFIPSDVAYESDVFKAWAEDSTKAKWVFDVKRSVVALLHHGITMENADFDLLLASYLINPSENHHDIPAIGHRLGKNNVLYDEEVYGKGAKMKIPDLEAFSDHLARKAMVIYQLKPEAEAKLSENEQLDLFRNLEMPLASILGEMEYLGVQVDVERIKEMKEELGGRLSEIEQKVYELAGEEFNLNSPKQLGPILFEKLGLPVIKKTKTGYSTSADVLEQLADQHEIIQQLLLYRQLGKLQSTYIEGLLKVVDNDTNKIHTRFNQALTQTGRLSSTEPNLQNIPIRLEEGRKIRQAFVPSKEDSVIFAADYSQIELRVLAHIAQDEKLIEAFNEDMDIHSRTAMDVFHVEEKDITSNMRRQAKAVNFGIVYGISDYGLSQSLGITRKDAQQFIDRYLKSFPGVKTYMEDIVQDAKQKGFVTTLMNRRRYLPDLTSRNFNMRSFAERTAMNTPIQGSAADIIKKAMIDLAERLETEQMEAKLLLSVHDELILEAPESELEKLKEIVPDVMEHAVELDVPLKVEYAYGKTWYDAK
ncbi:DNA polymerase I [Terribacillus saccharophilus]|uniref:DNA polymerase I n=1 Tax=Terribacillus saccharophilus TaxID=361277 RepID=A0A075LRI4_9BACI|nr:MULTISPECIES: DNA polymerase I [Terribacillus]AIF67078.1 DNA polymerase I [Terribacillus goriensis]